MEPEESKADAVKASTSTNARDDIWKSHAKKTERTWAVDLL
jgi:hypothetical protein